MTLISLTTDFGLQDGYVGVMKAVIYGIVPAVKIVDISHQVSPQNIQQGGLALAGHVGYFPAGSIHIVVVDPGVGTARRPMAASIGRQFYVAPDNGVLSPIIEQAERASQPMTFVCIDNPAYWLDRISHTFHGRDIFSPMGAHLANGVPLSEIGTPIDDPVLLRLPAPAIGSATLTGEVIYIDHFGNLRTSIHRDHLPRPDQLGAASLEMAGETIDKFVETFGEAAPGDLVAIWHWSGYLGLSLVNGSAAEKLRVGVGDPLIVRL